MRKKFSKADLRHIAEGLIEDLRECEDGTVTTTWRLLKAQGYEEREFEDWDLFDIHDALFNAARANKITLDMSVHDNRCEGLLYNLDFVVRNKKAQIKCPYCGSRDTARYVYGNPAFTEEMREKLDSGKWALGGCCIRTLDLNGKRVDIMPARKCNKCRKDFGKAPVLISPKSGIAEDYRDIVMAIKFSVGGYFGGFTEVKISKNDKGAWVSVRETIPAKRPEDIPQDRQITPARWEKIVNTLYGQMYLHEWKKSYVDQDVLDGTQWSLEIKLTGGRKRTYTGSNDYPTYWNELLKMFKPFADV